MLLTIDIGNTNVTCGLFRGSRLLKAWNLKQSGLLSFENDAARSETLDGICMCSVAPGATVLVREACKDAFGIEPLVAGSWNAGMPIVGYDPKQLGADRLMAALAAYERYRKALIVVDAGTAITIDLVDADGAFRGGAIAPGVGLSAQALHEATGQLPLVEPAPARRAIGRDTRSAINSGLVNGAAGLIDRLAHDIAREGKVKPLVVATGGDANLLKKHCASIERVHPHLVLEGLRIVWESHGGK
jgi:type III pantothenate kinase